MPIFCPNNGVTLWGLTSCGVLALKGHDEENGRQNGIVVHRLFGARMYKGFTIEMHDVRDSKSRQHSRDEQRTHDERKRRVLANERLMRLQAARATLTAVDGYDSPFKQKFEDIGQSIKEQFKTISEALKKTEDAPPKAKLLFKEMDDK